MLPILISLLCGGDPDFSGAFRSGVRVEVQREVESPADSPAEVKAEKPAEPVKDDPEPEADPPQSTVKLFASEPGKAKLPMRLAQQFQSPEWVSSLSRAVRFDPDPPAMLMKAMPRRKLSLIVPPGLSADSVKHLKQHPMFEIEFLRERFKGCDRYPAMYDWESDTFFHDEALNSWDTLIAEMNDELRRQDKAKFCTQQPVGAARAGGIKQEWLDGAVMVFRYFPAFAGAAENDAFSHADGVYLFSVPENLGISWSTDNGATTVKFSIPIKAGVNLVKTTCPAVIVRPQSLTVCLDWAPDLVLEAE
ncbi:MAG: hypothetical protein U0872_15415 [Planctomycetaceae bacterium]